MNNVYARVYVNEIICLELCRIEIMKKKRKNIHNVYIYMDKKRSQNKLTLCACQWIVYELSNYVDRFDIHSLLSAR